MFKKISDFLAGLRMTIISGVFLAASLVLLLINCYGCLHYHLRSFCGRRSSLYYGHRRDP